MLCQRCIFSLLSAGLSRTLFSSSIKSIKIFLISLSFSSIIHLFSKRLKPLEAIFSRYLSIRLVYFSIQLYIVWSLTSIPSSLIERAMLPQRLSAKVRSSIAVVIPCGLCFIFSKPMFIVKYFPQSLHPNFWMSPCLLCLMPYLMRLSDFAELAACYCYLFYLPYLYLLAKIKAELHSIDVLAFDPSVHMVRA